MNKSNTSCTDKDFEHNSVCVFIIHVRTLETLYCVQVPTCLLSRIPLATFEQTQSINPIKIIIMTVKQHEIFNPVTTCN